MRFRIASVLVLPVVLLCAKAQADTITYIETATASGKLDGVKFADATVTFTGIGDSSLVSDGSGIYSLVLPVSVTVAGVGSGEFKQTIDVVSNTNSSVAGFGDVTSNLAILFDENAGLATFNLAEDLGPTSGTPLFNAGQSFGTTDGALVLNDVSDVSFEAIESSVPSPEPSTFVMLGTGMAGVMGMVRRRRG
jgi:hypothetical protein